MNRARTTSVVAANGKRRLTFDLLMMGSAVLVTLAAVFHAPITGWLAGA